MAKKFLAILVVLVMVLGFTAPVAAAGHHMPPPPPPHHRRYPRPRPRPHHHRNRAGDIITGVVIGVIIARM